MLGVGGGGGGGREDRRPDEESFASSPLFTPRQNFATCKHRRFRCTVMSVCRFLSPGHKHCVFPAKTTPRRRRRELVPMPAAASACRACSCRGMQNAVCSFNYSSQ